ncbi:aminotransferase class III-fold pyridoxal phosphate-dependent enzyme [Bradyrhizobium sp. 38]|nr:aminotransferase class III-fold pyridoxal phosphate-dependent enzyme [Bradyrhizobium sp. 38]MCK1778665.1 aminotransferase class III-fold pyridoxal phosphate-dependent enzyme [Bradyrhizobium sp. 132]
MSRSTAVLGPSLAQPTNCESLLVDRYSGIDRPAAILVEAVQRNSGMNVAGKEWLRSIQAIAKETGAVVILDETEALWSDRPIF